MSTEKTILVPDFWFRLVDGRLDPFDWKIENPLMFTPGHGLYKLLHCVLIEEKSHSVTLKEEKAGVRFEFISENGFIQPRIYTNHFTESGWEDEVFPKIVSILLSDATEHGQIPKNDPAPDHIHLRGEALEKAFRAFQGYSYGAQELVAEAEVFYEYMLKGKPMDISHLFPSGTYPGSP